MRRILRLIAFIVSFSSFGEFGYGAITLGVIQNNVTCNGGNDGAINLTPGGGIAPYTYNWNGGSTNQNRTNLIAGTYDVTVTDNAGATAALAVVITEAPRFIVGVNTTSENCGGQSIGTITLNVSGATPGYTYLWNDGTLTQNRINLSAAVYYVTITDSKLCTTVDSANITQPPGIGITSNISLTTCGANNGAINLTVQFGTPNYSYHWNDGSILQNRAGLAIGPYSVTVTDAIGCSASAIEVVSSLPGSLTINTAFTQPVCSGGANGTTTVTSVVGSIGPYSYLWNGGSTANNLTGLTAGAYSVTVTSLVGCTSSTTVNVTQPSPINVQLTVIPLTCFGSNNGAINTNVNGGIAPYTFHWSGGQNLRNVMMLQSLNYIVTVTDFAGCSATASTFVPQPLQLTASATPSALACTGGPTGSVITTVAGGTPVYTYWWGAGITSQNRINVNSGNYDVTVTDGNGCTASAGANIPAYTPMALSTSQVNNVCFAGSTGSIDLNVSNGLNPYSFSWNTGSGAQNISSLINATYTVSVTDGHGCTASTNSTITGPLFATIVNSTIVDPSCNGANNGSININLNNGNAPFTYNWGGGINTQNRTNLTAGNYFLTTTDNSGCTVTASFNVSQPTPISITPTQTDVSCFAGNNGVIDINVTGSFAPYTYHWNDAATSQNRINITAGNYAVTVTDNRSCTGTASMVITQPTQITVVPAVVNLACNGISTGSINIAVNGGTGGYTYNWGGGVTSQNRTNLAAGTYVVTVSDNSNCTVSSQTVLTQPAAISIAFTPTNVLCNGGTNGSILTNVTGGTSPYAYNWGGGIITPGRTNIIAGTYTVSVTDFSGCTGSSSATVTEPAVLAVTAIPTNVICNGGNNGAINLTVTGGTNPYSFNWGGGITTQNRASLVAGNYSVTVTDFAGCLTIGTSVISQPAALNITATKTDVICNGGSNGSINIAVVGGTNPYTFSWGGGITSQNRTNLVAGNYPVTVTDNAGCTAVNATAVTQPSPLVITPSQTNISCNGGSNGAINITVTGSTAPYTYNWGGGIISQNRTNIASGNYAVWVTDANGCTVASSFVVTQPNVLSLSLAQVNVGCFGQSTGAANLTVTGGTSAYTYLWSNNTSAPNLSLVAAGAYAVTVTDAHLCTASTSVAVTQPAQINVAIGAVQNASCFNSATGSISLTATGGTGAYAYLWSNNSITQHISGLTAGTYLFTVSDANHCWVSGSATVTQPAAIVINTSQTNVSCYNGSNGQITSVVSGGNGAYSYSWSNHISTSDLSNLPAATYLLTVTDATNCSVSTSVNITQPSVIAVTTIPVNVSCNGLSNGSVNLNVSGGAGTYSFVWSNGALTQQINNLVPNNYSVTVTDANACTATQSAVITAPAVTTVTATHTDYACAAHAGSINLTPAGTAPFNFNWTGGITTQNRSNLAAGSYSVTLTDANLCTATNTVVITALPAISPSLVARNVSCFGGNNGAINLTLTGGTQPFIYRWNNNASSPNLSNLTASQYGIVVTDANNCSASATVSVSQPAQIQIAQQVTAARCFGSSDGIIDINVTGGTPAYTYSWSNNSVSQNISGLAAGSYKLTVTDANLCTVVSVNINLTQPTQIAVASVVLPIGCSGQADGVIQLSVNGGTGPYNFLWSNASVAKDVYGLTVGNYSVTVSDINGCATVQSYLVGSAPPIIVTADIHNVSCTGMTNGSISLNVGGGTPGYTYFWSVGSPLDLEHLNEGIYGLTVSDALNCSAKFSFNVAADYTLTLHTGPSVSIKPGQFAPLIVSANVDHNNVYTWAPSASLSCTNCLAPEASPLQTTNYTVFVSDTNGCKASAEVTVKVNTIYNIFIPNAFSPNGDGNNDEFQIFGDINTVNYLELSVFNRWGELVFETRDSNFKWDGNYKGEAAPQGVYIYVMKAVFSDGSNRDFKGSVTLIR